MSKRWVYDILVVGYGETNSEALLNHDQNVARLLDRAKQVHLKLNKNKVKLRQAEVKFMGHVISRDGLKPDPDKVSQQLSLEFLPCLLLSTTYLNFYQLFRCVSTFKRAYN